MKLSRRESVLPIAIIHALIMKDKIKQAILSILAEKRRNGDVLPFATSIEVAHLLHMNALDVEKIAEDIVGIVKGKTLNEGYYYE